MLGDKELYGEVEAVPILGDIMGNKGEIMENVVDRCGGSGTEKSKLLVRGQARG